MKSYEEKVRLAASITFDRFGQRAQKEIGLRINELKQCGEHDGAQFWRSVEEAVKAAPPVGQSN